jgi:hypothetical protein
MKIGLLSVSHKSDNEQHPDGEDYHEEGWTRKGNVNYRTKG